MMGDKFSCQLRVLLNFYIFVRWKKLREADIYERQNTDTRLQSDFKNIYYYLKNRNYRYFHEFLTTVTFYAKLFFVLCYTAPCNFLGQLFNILNYFNKIFFKQKCKLS